MASRKNYKIDQSLCKKGFQKNSGKHHIYYTLYDENGKKSTIFTKMSHSHKEIGDTLLSEMAKDTRLSNKKFLELVDCSLDKEGYLTIVFPK